MTADFLLLNKFYNLYVKLTKKRFTFCSSISNFLTSNPPLFSQARGPSAVAFCLVILLKRGGGDLVNRKLPSQLKYS